jgi:putative addiction module component (TIGR02574 family)
MSEAAQKVLEEALALSDDERLQLASELLASVDGPKDAGWDAAWLAELDRRAATAEARGDKGAEWQEVRSRILRELGRT